MLLPEELAFLKYLKAAKVRAWRTEGRMQCARCKHVVQRGRDEQRASVLEDILCIPSSQHIVALRFAKPHFSLTFNILMAFCTCPPRWSPHRSP